MKIQTYVNLRIMKRFLSKSELEKFQEKYDECKSATTNNLKSKAISDVDKNFVKEIVREVIKENKKKFTIWG